MWVQVAYLGVDLRNTSLGVGKRDKEGKEDNKGYITEQ